MYQTVLEGTVVETEAINVNVRDQSLLTYKDRDRLVGGGLDPTVESIGVVLRK